MCGKNVNCMRQTGLECIVFLPRQTPNPPDGVSGKGEIQIGQSSWFTRVFLSTLLPSTRPITLIRLHRKSWSRLPRNGENDRDRLRTRRRQTRHNNCYDCRSPSRGDLSPLRDAFKPMSVDRVIMCSTRETKVNPGFGRLLPG